MSLNEANVLGALLLNPEKVASVADWLEPADFADPKNRLVYTSMVDMTLAGEKVDVMLVMNRLVTDGHGYETGNGSYVLELVNGTVSSANVEAYAELVKTESKRRTLTRLGDYLQREADAPASEPGDIASTAMTQLLTLTTVERRGARSFADIGMDWFHQFRSRYEQEADLVGLPTPYAKLNKLTGGLCDGQLVIVAARPSMGKSAFAVNIGTSLALREEPKRVLMFNLEMTDVSIFNRAVASIGEIPLGWLRSPKDDQTMFARVSGAVSAIKAAPFLIDDRGGLTAAQICARARREHMKSKLDMVIVDHLHLVKLQSRDTVREIGDATAMFKALAKELEIPVVVLSQLNRSVDSRADKRPQMSDLRESGAIEQDADLILFLYRDDYYAEREGRESNRKGVVELIVSKQREGETGTVFLRDRLAYGLLAEMDSFEESSVAPRVTAVKTPRRSHG